MAIQLKRGNKADLDTSTLKVGEIAIVSDLGEIWAKLTATVAKRLATLNASGKLDQMPTAVDVGAVGTAEKGAANGVATLDANGKLDQMPTAADIMTVPVCRVRKNATQNIWHNDYTVFPSWDVVDIDTDSMFSTSAPTILTIKTAGIYRINAGVQFSANVTGARSVGVMVNALDIKNFTISASSTTNITPQIETGLLRRLNVGDNVKIYAYQNSGVLVTMTGSYNTFLEVTWIRP